MRAVDGPAMRAFRLLAVALLLAVPAADALNGRNFVVQGFEAAFPGGGVGIYDPSNPSDVCLAFRNLGSTAFDVVVNEHYYTSARMVVAASVEASLPAAVPLPLPPPLDQCVGFGLPPAQHLNMPGGTVSAGFGLFNSHLMEPSEVALASSVSLVYSYCPIASATVVPPGTAVTCAGGFAGSSGDLGPAMGWWTVPGWLRQYTAPVWAGSPMSGPHLAGQPSQPFVAQACLAVPVFDTVWGTLVASEDQDHVVVIPPKGSLTNQVAAVVFGANPANWSDLSSDTPC